jgi:hypothetical protein
MMRRTCAPAHAINGLEGPVDTSHARGLVGTPFRDHLLYRYGEYRAAPPQLRQSLKQTDQRG